MSQNTPEYRQRLIQEGRHAEASQAFQEALQSAPHDPSLALQCRPERLPLRPIRRGGGLLDTVETPGPAGLASARETGADVSGPLGLECPGCGAR
jgi:hypothetical protein